MYNFINKQKVNQTKGTYILIKRLIFFTKSTKLQSLKKFAVRTRLGNLMTGGLSVLLT